uniref:Immunity protein 50 of polymorphic toxin system n=1 Tax=Streptomyces sp. NBC_00049 TaxID=2903617 RepID=A0AAU2JT58_9ACTN
MTWSDFVVNGEPFAPYYDRVPELTGVRLRSVHLDAWGSAVVLRLDLPRFPDRWDGGPGDTMQCQVAFSHVEDFVLDGWRPPVTVDVVLTGLPLHRLAVRAGAPGTEVSFTANASVLAGSLSVFTRGQDGGDGGPHRFTRPVHKRLYETVPPTYVNTFHGRV